MLPVARLGDMHLCPIHGTSAITSASADSNVNHFGAARVGDACACGAVLTAGFPSITVGNLPLAYSGSPTTHGGTITSGSFDTAGGFLWGGTASHVVVDFAKMGAVHPGGLVNRSLMAALLADPHLEQRAAMAGALLMRPGNIAASSTPEWIAVAGSQHDRGSGNKMMFIGQAVRELAEFRRHKAASTRTLVLFTPAYSEAMLEAAAKSADVYGAALVRVTSADALIQYLNHGKDRKESPIERLSLFSHGVPQRIAFGYHLGDDARMSLDVLNCQKISQSAFSSSARVDSYACRTGMGNRPDYPIEEGVQFFPQTNESLAQLLANHLRVKVRAYIRRSDYKNTWGTFEERQLGKLCKNTGNAVPAEAWCKQWVALDAERQKSNKHHEFTYQTSGASHPVISGGTPFGVPGGHFEFLPK